MKIENYISIFLLFILFFSLGCNNADQKAKQADKETKIRNGADLVLVSRCNDCHTPYSGTDGESNLDVKRLLSGHPEKSGVESIPEYDPESEEWTEFLYTLENTVTAGPWGVSFAANITPDRETGIGNWTEQDFITAIRTGKVHGKKILQPMPWSDYGMLTDEELSSIFSYLQSVKPVKNRVPEPVLFK